MKFSKETLTLYAVTDGARTGERELAAALAGGVTCVQLREKNLAPELFLAKAAAFKALCDAAGVPLIINDSLDVALASGADAVHLGQSDGSLDVARRRLGEGGILGVSVHTPDEARRAEGAGADYLGVGAVFPTATKSDAKLVSLENLRAICSATRLPVVAIGGIGEGNIGQLAGTGIAGVAVVSALFSADDITGAARRLYASGVRALRIK